MSRTKTFFAGTFSVLALSAVVTAQPGPANSATTNASASLFAERPGMMRGPNSDNGAAFFGDNGISFVKSLMHTTDEEWKVIGPLLQSVISARVAANYSVSEAPGNAGPGGRFGGRGGPGGGFGPGGPGGGDSFADPGMGRRGGPGGGGPGPGGFGPGPDGFGPGPGGFGPGGQPGGFAGAGRPGENPGVANAPGSAPNAAGQNGAPAGGPPGGGFPGMGGGNNAVAAALAELRTAVAATNAAPDLIKTKLEAVRSARQKAKANLATAETKLRQLLTLEQQSVLASLGYLD